jgi:hypothetical protein
VFFRQWKAKEVIVSEWIEVGYWSRPATLWPTVSSAAGNGNVDAVEYRTKGEQSR